MLNESTVDNFFCCIIVIVDNANNYVAHKKYSLKAMLVPCEV